MTRRIGCDISIEKVWRPIKKGDPWHIKSWRCVYKCAGCWYFKQARCHNERPSQKVTLIWCSFFIFEEHMDGLIQGHRKESCRCHLLALMRLDGRSWTWRGKGSSMKKKTSCGLEDYFQMKRKGWHDWFGSWKCWMVDALWKMKAP